MVPKKCNISENVCTFFFWHPQYKRQILQWYKIKIEPWEVLLVFFSRFQCTINSPITFPIIKKKVFFFRRLGYIKQHYLSAMLMVGLAVQVAGGGNDYLPSGDTRALIVHSLSSLSSGPPTTYETQWTSWQQAMAAVISLSLISPDDFT